MNVNSPPPIPRLGTATGNAGGFPVLQIPGGSGTTTSLQTTSQPQRQSGLSSSTANLNAISNFTNNSSFPNNSINAHDNALVPMQLGDSNRNSPNQENNNNSNNNLPLPSLSSPNAKRPPATLTSQSMDRFGANNIGSLDTISDLRQYPLHSGSLHEAMNSMLRALIAISEEQKSLKESVQFTESSSKALNQKVLGEIAEINREFVQNLVRKKDWSDARFEDHRKVEQVARVAADLAQSLHSDTGTILPRLQSIESNQEKFKKETENTVATLVKTRDLETSLEAVQRRIEELNQAMHTIGDDMKKASVMDLEQLQQEYAGSMKTTHATLLQRIEQISMNQQAFELKISQTLDTMKRDLQTVSDKVAVIEVDLKSDRESAKSAAADLTAEVRKQDESQQRWKKNYEERFTSFHNGAFLRLARLESGADESGRAMSVQSRELTQVQSAMAEVNGDINELQTKVATEVGSTRKLIEDVSKRVGESEAYTKQKIESQSEEWRSTRAELDKKLKASVQEATEASAAVWKQHQRNESAWQESMATGIELKLRSDFARSLSDADETIAKLRSHLLRIDETQHVVINDLRTLNRDLSSQQTQMDNVVESLSSLETTRAKEFQKSALNDKQFRHTLQDMLGLIQAGNVENKMSKEYYDNDNDEADGDGNKLKLFNSIFSAANLADRQSLLEPVTLETGPDGMLTLTPRSKRRENRLVQNHQSLNQNNNNNNSMKANSAPTSLVNSRYQSPVRHQMKELTRNLDPDPIDSMQVFNQLPPPARSGQNSPLRGVAVAHSKNYTNQFSSAQHFAPNSEFSSNNNNNDRSSSALVIPAGLPKLGLEVANRMNGRGGVVVLGVTTHLPAYTAGLCRGDIVLSLGGQDVRTKQDFVDALRNAVASRQQQQGSGKNDRVFDLEVVYVAVSVEGEYDNVQLDDIPENRKRRVYMSAATMTA